jgi:ferredoxin
LTQALLDGWNAQGLVAEHFHTEAFGVAENPDQASYSVQLDQHALVFQGQPSLLALSPSAWPQADCRAGQCGGCLTRLEAGEVNWRLPAECAVPAGKILACCCVPLGPLRLSTG